MKLFYFIILIFLIEYTPDTLYGAQSQENTCNSTCLKMRKIYEGSPYVVEIHAFRKGGWWQTKGSSGTGVLIKDRETWYILTNNHLLKDTITLKVWVSFYKRGPMHEVTVIGRDHALDLALLSAPPIPAGIEPVKFGSVLNIGEPVYTLGYPFGIRSVTFGYVNALESFSLYYAWTQSPVYPGNSGGPLFNENHEMVGINTRTIRGMPSSFAMPTEYIKRILPRLKEEKNVQHGDAGFKYRNTSEIPPQFFKDADLEYPDATEQDKVIVVHIPSNSPAPRAGIRIGDKILKFNGLSVKDWRELEKKILFEQKPNDKVTFTIQRGAEVLERIVTLSEYTTPFPGQKEEE